MRTCWTKLLTASLASWLSVTAAAAAADPQETLENSRRLGSWFGYDTLEDFVIKNSRLQTLEDVAVAAGLAPGGPLATDGLLTLFAPSNWAFANTFATYPGLNDFLLNETNVEILQQVLAFHIVRGEILPRDIPTGGVTVPTLASELTGMEGYDLFAYKECHYWGWWCYVYLQDGSPDVTYVTGFNRFATNGVTHLINKVLIPPALADAVESFRPVV